MSSWRRHAMGLCGVAALAIGCVLTWGQPAEGDRWLMTSGVALRIGITLIVIWLALPQLVGLLAKVSPTTWLLLLLAGATVAVRPSALLVVGPVAAVVLAISSFLRWLRTPFSSDRKR